MRYATRPSCLRRLTRRAGRGFSLVEAAISLLIVGVMLAAVLNAVGAARLTQYKMGSQASGQLLAQDLMGEILAQRYEEPDGNPRFGPESGEATSARLDWDDVDDYRAWSASPPQDKTGQVIPGFEGWSRSVAVAWADPENLTQVSESATGVKRITVTVRRGQQVVASMVAVRTEAWPVDEHDAIKVLFVVTSSDVPTAQELARKALMASWGFEVTLITASLPQSAFDNAVAKADVAYVSQQIEPDHLGTKLANAPIGVVDEEAELVDEFEFAQGGFFVNRNTVRIADSGHYITSPFDTEFVTIFSSLQPAYLLTWGFAPGLAVLAEYHSAGPHYKSSLVVLEVGAELSGGGSAAGRRVLLPWGGDSFDINSLNEDGRTIMKRAIQWAAKKEEQP